WMAKAILGSLDPYSSYLTPTEMEERYRQISGTSVGIGIALEWVSTGFFLTQISSNSPAEKAGLRSGEVITSVNGKNLSTLSFEEADALLTGREGSVADLTVEGPAGRRDISIQRARFKEETQRVTFGIYPVSEDKKVSVIRIPAFYGPTHGYPDVASVAVDV